MKIAMILRNKGMRWMMMFPCLLTFLPINAQFHIRGGDDSPMRKLQYAEVAISNLYVDSVDEKKLVEDAIRGMLDKLDPHSSYSTPKEVKELNEPLTVTDIPPLSEEARAYLIRNDDYSNEYYIVENRQPTRFDAKLPGAGVIIFHIDYDELIWAGFTDYTNTPQTQHYTIFPANNNFSGNYSGWAYPYQDNNSLTDTSQPDAKLWHARADSIFQMSKPLTNITVNSNGLAAFDFMKDPSAIQAVFSPSEVKEQWFDLQGRLLPGRPQHKGLYIVNGRKLVVR